MKELQKTKDKDKIEQVKLQVQEIQTIFDYKIIPQKNHILFEVNFLNKTIKRAEYVPPKTTLYWKEALEMYHKVSFNKIDLYAPKTVTKSEVVKKENCIYVPALNKENVVKILKRDFNIIIK